MEQKGKIFSVGITPELLQKVFKDIYNNPADGERLEIIYDCGGDLNYKNALHIPIHLIGDKEKITKKIQDNWSGLEYVYDPTINFSFIPCTVIPPRINKRTKRDNISRCRTWIIEIEPEKNKKKLLKAQGIIPWDIENKDSRKELRELVEYALTALPIDICAAVTDAYVTGGGVNLLVEFDRVIEKPEIIKASDKLTELIRSLKAKYTELPLDESSGQLWHAQRLGTPNWKYNGFMPYWIDIRELVKDPKIAEKISSFEPYRVGELISDKKVVYVEDKQIDIDKLWEEATQKTYEAARENGYDFKELIEEIKRRADIPSIFNLNCKEHTRYYACSCPFHPPDKNPSFIVYKNEDGQVAKDFHNGESYDVIALAQALWGLDFKEAVETLAQHLGLPVEPELFEKRIREEKKKKEKEIAKQVEEEDLKAALEGESEFSAFVKEIGLLKNEVEVLQYGEYVEDWIIRFGCAPPNAEDVLYITLKVKDFDSPSRIERRLKVGLKNPNLVLPGEKLKEKKEFVEIFLSKLIDYAKEYGRYKKDESELQLLDQVIHEFLIDHQNLIVDEFQFLLSGGKALYKDSEHYWIGMELLISYIKRKGLFKKSIPLLIKELEKLSVVLDDYKSFKAFRIPVGRYKILSEEELKNLLDKEVPQEDTPSDKAVAFVQQKAQEETEPDVEEAYSGVEAPPTNAGSTDSSQSLNDEFGELSDSELAIAEREAKEWGLSGDEEIEIPDDDEFESLDF